MKKNIIFFWSIIFSITSMHGMDTLQKIGSMQLFAKKQKSKLWTIKNNRKLPVQISIQFKDTKNNRKAFVPQESVAIVVDEEDRPFLDEHKIIVRKQIDQEGYFSLDSEESIEISLDELPKTFKFSLLIEDKGFIISPLSCSFDVQKLMKDETMYPSYSIEEKSYVSKAQDINEMIDSLLEQVTKKKNE